MNNNTEKIFFSSSLGVEKVYLYSKKICNFTSKLKSFSTEKQRLSNFLSGSFFEINIFKRSGSVVSYTVHFSFSTTNTFLYITDTLGNLKFAYSAGSVDFKGKKKKSRIQVLNRFFRELKRLKISVLKNKPITLHLSNVSFHKYWIVRNLKKDFFIRFIKSSYVYAYNGCRKKKKLRRR
jgi:ribosomal protein S11